MVAINLIKFLDKYLGFLVCWFLSILPRIKSKKSSNPKTILVIQLWGIGESILTLPAIESLRERYANCNIFLLATERNMDVYYQNKNVDGIKLLTMNPFAIIPFILANIGKFDLVIDMEEYLNVSSMIAFFVGKRIIGYAHGVRSRLYSETVDYNDNQHVVLTFMDLLKPMDIDSKIDHLPRLKYSSEDLRNVQSLLGKLGLEESKLIVGLGVGAAESAKSRMWSKERFAEVADYLIDRYQAEVLFIGNDGEKKIVEEIQQLMKNQEKSKKSYSFAGLLSVREMFCLISLCKLFIGNDSGPMHVAAAQGVKTIGLFGCNLPARFAPYGKKNYSIRKSVSKPCINVHEGDVGECLHGKENACVKMILTKDVIPLIDKALGNIRESS
jgi:heptosyltransferase II